MLRRVVPDASVFCDCLAFSSPALPAPPATLSCVHTLLLSLDGGFFLLASSVNSSLLALGLPEIVHQWSPFSLLLGVVKIIPLYSVFCHVNSNSRGRGDKCM